MTPTMKEKLVKLVIDDLTAQAKTKCDQLKALGVEVQL
jgi:hypothetical protein